MVVFCDNAIKAQVVNVIASMHAPTVVIDQGSTSSEAELDVDKYQNGEAKVIVATRFIGCKYTVLAFS